MKKNKPIREYLWHSLKKTLLIMRIAVILLLVGFLQTRANDAYSQKTKLSFDFSNTKLVEVLDQIENKSEFFFLYNEKLIDTNRKVSIMAKDQGIEDVLKSLFKDTNISFSIIDRKIILSPMEHSGISQQQKSVSGIVTDSSGASLPGVSVVVKGTNTGTITDADGKFSIGNVPENATLQFSFVGMKGQEVTVENNTVINVILDEETIGIEEVVAIGYGTTARKNFVGSVSSVKLENSPISQLPNTHLLQSLKGNVAGLNIGAINTAGGNPSLLVRGQRSISGSNSPLIVLDGIIFTGSINDINPLDIETVDILKDATSAATYGSRSANGVIAITTKKGRTGKPMISVNANSGVQLWQNRPKIMRGPEWLKMTNLRGGYPEGSTTTMTPSEVDNYKAGKEVYWLDEVSHTGEIQNHQVNVSGGTENVNYYFSAGYINDKGIIVGDDYSRISILGKLNTTITNWLKVGIDASYSKDDYSGLAAQLDYPFRRATPYGNLYRDDQGNLEKYPALNESPLWGVDDGTTEDISFSHNYRLNNYIIVDAPWLKGLSFKANLALNFQQDESGNFFKEDYYIPYGLSPDRYLPSKVVGLLSRASGSINRNKTHSYVFDNILTYKKTFQKHRVEATLVATRDESRYEAISVNGNDFAKNGNTTLGIWGLHQASVQKVNLNIIERYNIGYLARLSYSFNDKYFLTGSYRRDGTSVFGANKKWAGFAGIGAAWNITKEEFLKNFEPLNYLKLKTSWGQNGNQGVGPYSTLSKVISGNSGGIRYEFSNAQGVVSYGMAQSTLGNADLGWESTDALNTGFESRWLNSRLSLDFDVYFTQTKDQIFLRNIPVMNGFRTVLASLGQVNNTGVELTVGSDNIKTKNLIWHTSITFWKNNNKLAHLYGEDKDGDGKEDDDIVNSFFIGKSLSAIYGWEQIGIVQVEDADYIAQTGARPGDPKYRDLDGKSGISATDRKILGYGKENFRLNMSNSISFKNFELYVMVNGIFGGNKHFLASHPEAFSTNFGFNNVEFAGIPYWTSENKNNVYPSPTFTYPNDSRYLALQSRGFVRIQDVSLSYNFNQPWLKAARISSMKMFISAKNMHTFTNWYGGGDPELPVRYLENFPVPSVYSVGVNINL